MLRMVFWLAVFVIFGTAAAQAYTPPDNPVACIQRLLAAKGISVAQSGNLDSATRSAAAKYVADKGWNLPVLDANSTDTWCDYLTAEAIGVPWLTSLPHPGNLYFDLAAARQRLPTDACASPLLHYSEQPHPVLQKTMFQGGVGKPEWGGDYAQYIMVLNLALVQAKPADNALMAGEFDTYAARLKSLLLEWATANVPLDKPTKGGEEPRDNFDWGISVLFPHVLQARNELDAAGMLSPAEEKTVDNWLAKLASLMAFGKDLPLGIDLLDPTSRYRNHNGRRAMDALLWASQTNDPGLFNWAVRTGYVRFLRTIYPDGHVPDSYRSSWAQWYTSLAIDGAVFSAVAAEQQGVDLFGLKVSGRGLPDAVKFLADSFIDETALNQYAKEAKFIPLKFPGQQDRVMRYLEEQTPITQVAWADFYVDRFPDDPSAKELLRVRDDIGMHTGYDDVFSISFGDVSCFWGPEKDKPL